MMFKRAPSATLVGEDLAVAIGALEASVKGLAMAQATPDRQATYRRQTRLLDRLRRAL